MNKIPVSILGATGAVGQQLLVELARSEFFLVDQVMASNKHQSRPLVQCARPWLADAPMPKELLHLPVESIEDKVRSKVVFSALPSSIAEEMEARLRKQGHFVFSLASSHRMDNGVAMVVLNVNEAHLELAMESVKKEGVIICKPNCVAAILSSVLKPLMNLGLSRVDAVSLQSLSGAGYPGPSAWQMCGDLLPEIEGEEAKIEAEIPKLLGHYEAFKRYIQLADIEVSMSCLRVPVARGHSLQLTLDFKSEVTEEKLVGALGTCSWLTHMSDSLELSPLRAMMRHEPMQVYWGRLRQIGPSRFKLWVVGDNLGRGAATGAVALAEYFCQMSALI